MVGIASASSRSSTAWPCIELLARPRRRSAMPRNSAMSAPAMKPLCLGRADDQRFRTVLLNAVEAFIEFLQHGGRQRVRARHPGWSSTSHAMPSSSLASRQCFELRRRVRGTEFELVVLQGVQHRRHRAALMPAPAASRRPVRRRCIRWRCRALHPRRFIALARCSTMRLPLVPTGWPSEMAPPSTLSRSRSTVPNGRSRPSTSRQKSLSSHAARQASTCAAKASFSSHRSMSPWRQAVALQHRRDGKHRRRAP